jgi:hypothetical protein
MIRLELQYLFEIGRMSADAARVVGTLTGQLGLKVCDRPFDRVVREAERQQWNRDSFDQIIVGQASLGQDTLVTRM